MAAEAEDDPKPFLEGLVTPRRRNVDILSDNQDGGQDSDVVGETSDEGEDEEDDADGVEDEPKLKYHRLTPNLSSVYRSGDATSSFLVSGDKLVIISHLILCNHLFNEIPRFLELIMATLYGAHILPLRTCIADHF
jgi:hypothetical protein